MKRIAIRILSAMAAAAMAFSVAACAGGNEPANGSANTHTGAADTESDALARVAFTIVGKTVYGTVYDNSVGRDFLSRLPMTLEFSDYNRTEKIAYLPDGEKLDTSGAPSSCDPSVGDITMYAPWGNIAIFYRDFGQSNGLVRFGRLDEGAIDLFASQADAFTVQISAVGTGVSDASRLRRQYLVYNRGNGPFRTSRKLPAYHTGFEKIRRSRV